MTVGETAAPGRPVVQTGEDAVPGTLLDLTDEAESGDAEAGVPHALLDERDFLVRSLQDLTREREAGDIDDADYHALRSRYASRLAAVARAVERAGQSPGRSTDRAGQSPGGSTDRAGQSPGRSTERAGQSPGRRIPRASRRIPRTGAGPPGHPAGSDGSVTGDEPAAARAGRAATTSRDPVRQRRRWLVGGAVGCFALAAVVLVVVELGVRLPGQTVTGSITLSKQQRIARLTDQGETALIQGNDAAAVVAFDDVLAIDPHQVEALSEAGWLQFAAGVRGHRAALVRLGQRDEAEAVAQAPSSFAPRFYYGAMLAQEHDFEAAVAQFEAGLADHPPSSTVSVFVTTIEKVFHEARVPVPAGLPPPTTG